VPRPLKLAYALRVSHANRQDRLRAVALAAARTWREEAKRTLNSSLGAYLRGMSVSIDRSVRDRPRLLFKLAPGLPTIIEFGSRGYDVRSRLSRFKNVRRAKDGHLYASIPFRHLTRGMSVAEYGAARQLTASIRVGTAPARAPYLNPAYRKVVTVWGERSPAGVYRVRRPGGVRSRYVSFRTVSERGRPWRHPGIGARHILRRVATRMPQVIRGLG